MNYSTLIYEEKDSIATIRLNRPESLNAVDTTMIREFIDVCDRIEGNDEIRAVVLLGNGKAFSAGGDIKEFETIKGSAGFLNHMILGSTCVTKLYQLTRPVVTGIHGYTMGAGLNLALACDIIIAADNLKLSEIFGKIGFIPDAGGTYILPRLVGRAKAKELVFTYKTIDAQEALSIGLVTRVVAVEELEKAVYELAGELAKNATVSINLAKQLINRSYETDLQSMLDYERLAQTIAANTEDFKEGTAAFVEKRNAQFKGR